MKNPAIVQPRFTCRLVRGCLSVFGETSGGEPRGPGASHVAHCADCRQFFSACDELARALRHDAAREWRDAPGGLEQNILRAVNLSVSEPASVPHRPRLAWVSLATAGACAVVAILVYPRWTAPGASPLTAQPNLAASAGDPATPAAARAAIATAPSDLFAQIQPKAQAILQQDPLQNEAEALASDARSAVRFLALNFMPTAPDRPNRGE